MFAIRFFQGIDFGRAHAGGGVVSKTYESLGLVWQVPQTDSSCVKRAEPLEKQKSRPSTHASEVKCLVGGSFKDANTIVAASK